MIKYLGIFFIHCNQTMIPYLWLQKAIFLCHPFPDQTQNQTTFQYSPGLTSKALNSYLPEAGGYSFTHICSLAPDPEKQKKIRLQKYYRIRLKSSAYCKLFPQLAPQSLIRPFSPSSQARILLLAKRFLWLPRSQSPPASKNLLVNFPVLEITSQRLMATSHFSPPWTCNPTSAPWDAFTWTTPRRERTVFSELSTELGL